MHSWYVLMMIWCDNVFICNASGRKSGVKLVKSVVQDAIIYCEKTLKRWASSKEYCNMTVVMFCTVWAIFNTSHLLYNFRLLLGMSARRHVSVSLVWNVGSLFYHLNSLSLNSILKMDASITWMQSPSIFHLSIQDSFKILREEKHTSAS